MASFKERLGITAELENLSPGHTKGVILLWVTIAGCAVVCFGPPVYVFLSRLVAQ